MLGSQQISASTIGLEIPNNHLGCRNLSKYWDKLPTSTGDHRISKPSTVAIGGFRISYVHLIFTPGEDEPILRSIFSNWGMVQAGVKALRILPILENFQCPTTNEQQKRLKRQ